MQTIISIFVTALFVFAAYYLARTVTLCVVKLIKKHKKGGIPPENPPTEEKK